MAMKKSYLVYVFICLPALLSGQDYALTFEKADTLMREEARPLLIFLHAPWCRYCEAMKGLTFKNREIQQMLEEDFYFVSFDGESREKVVFGGQSFGFEPSGAGTGTHQLARQLGEVEGRLTYPTLVFVDPEYRILFSWNAFLPPDQLKEVLKKIKNEVERQQD